MLRRLAADQPASFAFTPANLEWARGQMTKYPEGRQASAVIPILWRAQEQEGWLTRPAIEEVGRLLGMPYIRVLEVATFYFMFQLEPVGSVAHIQICGTTSCMICGAEDLIRLCKERIAPKPHMLSPDGKFSWEEVECLGACTNAPMAQIGKDYYEDLTVESLTRILDQFAAGERPVSGPQNGRYAAEALSGLTTLQEFESGKAQYNASVDRAMRVGDGTKRIDGTEVPLTMPWLGKPKPAAKPAAKAAEPKPAAKAAEPKATAKPAAKPAEPKAAAKPAKATEPKATARTKAPAKAAEPERLTAPRAGKADDLKVIVGIGPKLEAMLHKLGFFHFDQLAAWTKADLEWVDRNLDAFKGRAVRENWVGQARDIVKKSK